MTNWKEQFRKKFIKGHDPLPNGHHDVQQAESWVEADQEELEDFISNLLASHNKELKEKIEAFGETLKYRDDRSQEIANETVLNILSLLHQEHE